MYTVDQQHRPGRGAGNQAAFKVAGRNLAGIDDVQTVNVLLWRDRQDDRLGVQVLRQRELDENAMDGRVGIELGHQLLKRFLSGVVGQTVLDRFEAALLGHLALGIDIGMAGRIVADDDDCKAWLHAGFPLERTRSLGHRGDYRCCRLFTIDHHSHAHLPLETAANVYIEHVLNLPTNAYAGRRRQMQADSMSQASYPREAFRRSE